MHSPESTQELAHLRAAAGPSPMRTMSRTPAIVPRGSASAMPAAAVIGQPSKHLPHLVQASSISSTRLARAVSNVCSIGPRSPWPDQPGPLLYRGPDRGGNLGFNMKHSTGRILTTHVGSLIRPPALQEFL